MKLPQTLRRGYLWLSLVMVGAGLFVWLHGKEEKVKYESVATVESVQSGEKDERVEQRRSVYVDRVEGRGGIVRRRDDDTVFGQADRTAHSVSYGQAEYGARKQVVVELNGADSLTLQLVNGIGPTFARRIVRWRDRLGGFVDKRQLMEVKGMTEEHYNQIAPQVSVMAEGIRRLPINSITLKELNRHPYIDPYQARDVIAFREKGHRYESVESLLLVATMDEETVKRLAPYLDFN